MERTAALGLFFFTQLYIYRSDQIFNALCKIFLMKRNSQPSLKLINVFACNTKNFTKAFLVVSFFFSFCRRCFSKGLAKAFFANVSRFITHEACDQDRTC